MSTTPVRLGAEPRSSHSEHLTRVRHSLGRLDAASRELLRLKFDEALSYRDISARTGLAIGQVAQVLHGALKALADSLAGPGAIV